jgi:dTDP-4-dehydrorhamnose reductase
MTFISSEKAPILVTGANGMLGGDLVEAFSAKWGSKSVVATDYLELDITQLSQVENFLQKKQFSYIVNAAAYTEVDRAEKERDKAYLINVVGPENLSAVANNLGIPVVHFSTDYVFDGSAKVPLTEKDTPRPCRPNYYGETKLLAEKEILKNPMNLVLRIQWLYGKKRERFTALRNKSEFTPFVDQWGAPCWTQDVSRVVVELIEQRATGLFHFAYDDYANWFEVYELVVKELDLSTRLIPKKTAEVNLPAQRPLYCVMSNKKLLHQLGRTSLGSWKDSLRTFLKSL